MRPTDKELRLMEQLNTMRDQLLIVLVRRLGGDVSIPLDEIDGTGNDNLMVNVDADDLTFRFQVKAKKAPN